MAVDTIARGMAASAQGGSSDYSDLTNKPSINGVTLSGNKTSSDLGIPNIFIATYNVTYSSEITAAIAAGKTIIAVKDGMAYNYVDDSDFAYSFVNITNVNQDYSKTQKISVASSTNTNSWSGTDSSQTPLLLSSLALKWGFITTGGTVTPSITLPFGVANKASTLIYTFTAATTGATFTAPNNAMIIDTDGATTYTTGNSLVLSDLTAGNFYECNFSCYQVNVSGNQRIYIILLMKGYPVA